MIRDPIVDEVRAIREELAAKFNFDIRKIVEDAQRRQATSQSRVVSFQRPTESLAPSAPPIAVSNSSTPSDRPIG
jgi:predicted Holliday junction resolvase-like endonuclease